MSRPDRATEALVRKRARERCEYCHLPEAVTDTPFQIDHVIAEKHGGPTNAKNLAFACYYCNTYKGPNLSGIDPLSRRIKRLFNPRSDAWEKHFRWEGGRLSGLSAIGRTTIETLRMNEADALAARTALLIEGELID